MASIYKEDCKWYDYWQDMGARIPFCKAGKNMDASGFFLETCDGCKDYSNKNVTTNADRIRNMTDEELAEFIGRCVDHEFHLECVCFLNQFGYCQYPTRGCDENALEWLKQEVKE